MRIIGLQRRARQVGRIRLGEQVANSNGRGTRPRKLSRFRLTCGDPQVLAAVAALYGGDVHPWDGHDGQHELYTDATSLPIVLPPEDLSWSTSFEMWDGPVCSRRCNGERRTDDEPCTCDPDNRDCEMVGRLSVMLADVPTVGLWRLDTKGFYGVTELDGMVTMLEQYGARGVLLPARLVLQNREVKRRVPDRRTGEVKVQTFKFVVPGIEVDVTPRALAGGRMLTELDVHTGPPVRALPAGPPDIDLSEPLQITGSTFTPVDPAAQETPPAAGTIAEQLARVGEPPARGGRRSSTPSMPPTDVAVGEAQPDVDVPDDQADERHGIDAGEAQRVGVKLADLYAYQRGAHPTPERWLAGLSPEATSFVQRHLGLPDAEGDDAEPAVRTFTGAQRLAMRTEKLKVDRGALCSAITNGRTSSGAQLTEGELTVAFALLAGVERGTLTVVDAADGWPAMVWQVEDGEGRQPLPLGARYPGGPIVLDEYVAPDAGDVIDVEAEPDDEPDALTLPDGWPTGQQLVVRIRDEARERGVSGPALIGKARELADVLHLDSPATLSDAVLGQGGEVAPHLVAWLLGQGTP